LTFKEMKKHFGIQRNKEMKKKVCIYEYNKGN
jgi:hypothetical protein